MDFKPPSTPKKVLIVDDEEPVRRTLVRLLRKIQAECWTAFNAEQARSALRDESFNLVLCDIIMPGENGLELAAYIRSEYPETALIMVTGVGDPDIAEKALDLGAYGYIVKPFKVNEVIINISSGLRRQKLEAENWLYQKNLEQLVADRTMKLDRTLNGVIQALGRTVESRDPYTAGHQRRVTELACAIAKELGLSTDQIEGIHMAGMIHDLGKLSVPAEILSKPTQLTEIEFSLIKAHPQVGYDILKEIEFPWPIALMIFQHHERINGIGYPRGLKGEEILLEARILSVADVVEAMASYRPYRPAIGIHEALLEISKNGGILYDSEVAETCLKLFYEGRFRFSDEKDRRSRIDLER